MSTEQNNQQEQQDVNYSNPFSEENWVDPSVENNANEDQSNPSNSSIRENAFESNSSDEEIVDANDYLKKRLGFEDWDSAEKQLEELRKRESISFENEDSRKFFDYVKDQKEDELIDFLQTKKRIEKLSTSEIKDADTAAEIVKMNMYQKNQDLDADEIDFLFNEKFQKPAKPDQRFDELDSEYEERVAAWENKVNEINKRLVIEAKLARPEIEKLRSSLVLPDISSNVSQQSFTPEELESQKRYMDDLYGRVNTVVNSFDGFSTTVKDEGTDFTVSYIPSYEEKQAVANQLKYFAENNLDANMIFADRWVNDDNTINVEQMTKDLFLIQNEGKITQKYVNDAANKKLTMHLKRQSNINLNSASAGGTFSPDNRQSEMDKLAAVMFAK